MRQGLLYAFLATLLMGHAALAREIVNDVTQINPIAVSRVVTPQSIEEIQKLIAAHEGPVSIGGGKFSMGGQTASENTLHFDMRRMDRVLSLSKEAKSITVEAGITWRKIQEKIDPLDLSVKIMQSYANFTVGGSLSVNVHGRYVGQGPVILSVRSIKVVLADGKLVSASPTENSEIFYAVIGGYGGIGVIVEATLELDENVRVQRFAKRMKLDEYKTFFDNEIRSDKAAVFHNGDIYPPSYTQVIATTFRKTDLPVTVKDRLMSPSKPTIVDRVKLFGVSEMPFGKVLRAKVLDPLMVRGNPVVWRNYEASYDVGSLEPVSRSKTTYVLQEYFVPVGKFDEFAAKMKAIFQKRKPNILNVSIRHSIPDPGSLLAWAQEEVFAFVVYYKQGVSEDNQQEVAVWTRELIDAALTVGGRYYLPYQIVASDQQFHQAYPRAKEYFALKKKLDPNYRFRNKLWDRYYLHDQGSKASARDEEKTFLTLPEWYVVFSADELGAFTGRPSDFPFFASIGQFWSLYGSIWGATWGKYGLNLGTHVMIAVVGVSFTAEYFLRGLYENSIGLLTEWTSGMTSGSAPSGEDLYLRSVAQDYAQFIHLTPWYAYPFWSKLKGLWSVSLRTDAGFLRRWERTFAGTWELAIKSVYAGIIGAATGAAYAPEDLVITAITSKKENVSYDPRVVVSEPEIDRYSQKLTIPRYEPFTGIVSSLAKQGVPFKEIAGNDDIVMTLIAPKGWTMVPSQGQLVHEWPILTAPTQKRVAVAVDVGRLHELIPAFEAQKAMIDHVYDY